MRTRAARRSFGRLSALHMQLVSHILNALVELFINQREVPSCEDMIDYLEALDTLTKRTGNLERKVVVKRQYSLEPRSE